MRFRFAVLLFVLVAVVYTAAVAEKPDADRSKRVIELPAKALVADAVRPIPEHAARERPEDMSKALIELPPKKLLADTKPVAKPEAKPAEPKVVDLSKLRADMPKMVIEGPPKHLLAESSSEPAAKNTSDTPLKKVVAGKVRWHKDFATAVAKSKSSHKPVLLFQLLGQLDEEFT